MLNDAPGSEAQLAQRRALEVRLAADRQRLADDWESLHACVRERTQIKRHPYWVLGGAFMLGVLLGR